MSVDDIEEYLRIMNETGFFLQMRIAQEADQIFDMVSEEIAFEHGGETSKLDVLAELSHDDLRVFFFLECKRHLHEYSSWVFFKPNIKREPFPPYLLGFGDFRKKDLIDPFYSSSAINIKGSHLNLGLIKYPYFSRGFLEPSSLEFGNIGIEVRLPKSKYRMSELTGVSKDIVIATHGMAMEIEKHAREGPSRSIGKNVLFVPIIVTTAKLLGAKADASKVILSNGRLSKKWFELKEVPWIVYEYSLTARLLLPVNTGRRGWSSVREDKLRRRHIFIVNSESVKNFLEGVKLDLCTI